jgi:hypothetical protein
MAEDHTMARTSRFRQALPRKPPKTTLPFAVCEWLKLYPGIKARALRFTSINGGRGPYQFYNDRKILFIQFSGQGPPPSGIGYPGDIYLDSASEKAYTNTSETIGLGQWKVVDWTEKHPLFPERYLSVSKGNVISWMARKSKDAIDLSPVLNRLARRAENDIPGPRSARDLGKFSLTGSASI